MARPASQAPPERARRRAQRRPSADRTAVAQEIVRVVGRSDISEEVTRFRGAPRSTGSRSSEAAEPCGRKLDFLLQEMNREINTIGSKADGGTVSGAGGDGERPSSRRCASRCRMSSEVRGQLFIISAPSGTGKTTLAERLVQVMPDLALSRSFTSRPPRAGELDGVDYNFISRERFEVDDRGRRAPEMRGRVRQSAARTSAATTEQALAHGQDLVLVIDVQGARQVRSQTDGSVGIFVLPPSFPVLEERLRGRSKDTEAQIQRRLAVARSEVSAVTDYDYAVVNDDRGVGRGAAAVDCRGRAGAVPPDETGGNRHHQKFRVAMALIALGVTGGIGAYKAVEVARLLQKRGHDVAGRHDAIGAAVRRRSSRSRRSPAGA